MPAQYYVSFIIIYVLIGFSYTIAQRQFPAISCPGIFQYSFDESLGGNIGLVTIQRDGSSTSEIQVNMSMNTYMPVESNIKIVLLSTQDEIFYGNSIKYAIKFPLKNVVPKVTQILFNGNVVCRANPDPLTPGVIQTSMWAMNTVKTINGISPDIPLPLPVPASTSTANSLFVETPPNSASFPNSAPFPFDVSNNTPLLPPSWNSIDRMRNRTSPPQIPIESSTEMSVSSPAPNGKPYQCGKTIKSHNLIVGGDDIGLGDFPWLAAIMHKEATDYSLYCTGNLISDKHVLTTGLCVRYRNADLYNIEEILIVFGKLDMEEWQTGGTPRQAQKISSHPMYKQGTADYNIAVILLNKPVTFSPTIRPICLWDDDDNIDRIVGDIGTVVGWAKKGAKQLSLVAQKVEMPVVSQTACLRSNEVFFNLTSPRTFCAGNGDQTTGPCTGDTGAGFMIQDLTTEKWSLRGLVAYSIKDPTTLSCNLKEFIVFVDVAKMTSWVKEEMK